MRPSATRRASAASPAVSTRSTKRWSKSRSICPGRPFFVWDVALPDALPLGTPPFDPQLAEHAFQSFATAAGITLHVSLRRGRNVHHIIEASFKGLARCLRDAVRVEGTNIPSTKGVL